MTHQLTLTALPNVPFVKPGNDLVAILLDSLQEAKIRLQSDDVLVIAQKIISKAEGRLVKLSAIIPSARAIEIAQHVEKDPRQVEVILGESKEIVRMRPGVLVVEHRLGFVCANAGVDRSNVETIEGEEYLLLLPENPDRTCAELREKLLAKTGATIGVIINDSHGRAWRNGAVGMAIGVAGIPALLDLRGRTDLFNCTLNVTQIGLADELAAAASLLMGQADEGRPVIHARGIPYSFREGTARELIREKELDMFR